MKSVSGMKKSFIEGRTLAQSKLRTRSFIWNVDRRDLEGSQDFADSECSESLETPRITTD